MIYNNIVACHINLGNFDLARKNIELARKVGQSNLNIIEVTRTHLWDAEIQFRQENYQSAIKNALLAYQTAEENNQVDILADASRILSESYKSKGQYKQGFEYLELNQIWQDSLFNEDEMKIPLSKDFEYQLEKQKREQELQQEKNKLAYESEIKFQKLILSFFILAFLVIGMAAFAFYKNYNAKKKAEKELAKKNTMLQKYIESNIQLEQFAHIASHDLKSPLRTVGSFSSLLKRRAASKLNENEIEYLDMIENAAKLMWNLVDDLMAYSQVNSLQMNLKQHDINNLIQEVLSNLNFSIEEKNAEIVISNMPTQVKVDETKKPSRHVGMAFAPPLGLEPRTL